MKPFNYDKRFWFYKISNILIVVGVALLASGVLALVFGHYEKMQTAKDQCGDGVLVRSYNSDWVCLKLPNE